MYTIEELANYISLKEIPNSWNNCFEEIKKSYNHYWLKKYDFDLILNYYEFEEDFVKLGIRYLEVFYTYDLQKN